jgi:hypothetical protein
MMQLFNACYLFAFFFLLKQQRYDTELQAYLRATGLQASDLSKPRPKKKEPIKPSLSSIPAGRQVMSSDVSSGVAMLPPDGLPPFSLVWSRGQDGENGSTQLGTNGTVDNTLASANNAGSSAFLLAPFG